MTFKKFSAYIIAINHKFIYFNTINDEEKKKKVVFYQIKNAFIVVFSGINCMLRIAQKCGFYGGESSTF